MASGSVGERQKSTALRAVRRFFEPSLSCRVLAAIELRDALLQGIILRARQKSRE
jgi:hypothetical protein